MKKVFTFTNIIAISAFVALMLFFAPSIALFTHESTTEPHLLINLFQATFGTTIANPSGVGTQTILPCAGLIVAFVFMIIGMILSVVKNKIKLVGLGASASYITAGVLIACAVPMITDANYTTIGTTMYKFRYYGWAIAIATIVCFIGLVALFDTLASTAKPKVQEVY